MTDCPHVSIELADGYPPGTMVCRQCGAIVPPETVHYKLTEEELDFQEEAVGGNHE